MSTGLHAGHLQGILPSRAPGEAHGVKLFGTFVEGAHFNRQQVTHVSSILISRAPLAHSWCFGVWSGTGVFSHNSLLKRALPEVERPRHGEAYDKESEQRENRFLRVSVKEKLENDPAAQSRTPSSIN